MFSKIQSINKIMELGLNMHRMYIPNTYKEYSAIMSETELCTIRTDHAVKTDDLPFYVLDNRETNREKAQQIWEEAQQNEYKLIISDGIRYDSIQSYNMTVQLQKNGDFMFEASDLKIPLRHMYRHPSTLLSCTGNIAENINLWKIINERYGINKLTIRRDITWLYSLGLFGKWLEITKYPCKVGIKQESIVFWQIK